MSPSYEFPLTIEGQMSAIRHGRWLGIAVMGVNRRSDWSMITLACLDGAMLDRLELNGLGATVTDVIPESHEHDITHPNGVFGWRGQRARILPRLADDGSVSLTISNANTRVTIGAPVGSAIWISRIGGRKVAPCQLVTSKGTLRARAQKAYRDMFPNPWDFVVSPAGKGVALL